jgi:hypothetical protein
MHSILFSFNLQKQALNSKPIFLFVDETMEINLAHLHNVQHIVIVTAARQKIASATHQLVTAGFNCVLDTIKPFKGTTTPAPPVFVDSSTSTELKV